MCFRKRNVRNSDRTIACVLTFVALIVGTVVQSWAEQTDPALALTEGVITLHSAGLSEDALPLAEKARRLLQERAEKRPNDYAMTLSNLAAVNLALGRMSEAEHQLREALAINERGLGGISLSIADTLRELGDALADQGKFEEAEALLRRGLNMLHSSQHSVTEDKSHLVPTLASLVSVLFAQRKTEEGEKLYREAVKAEKTRRRLLIIQTRHDNSLKKVHGGPAYKAMHVFYGTDRDVDTSGIYTVAGGRTQPKVHRFTDERGRELKLGRATVTIPKSHRFGALELPFSFSIPFTSVQISAAPFGHLHFTLPELEIQDLASFRNSVASINSASNPKEALIFVHGYNMDLDNALFRAAQLAFDLKHDGFTAAYSWPSNGDYLFSRESARQAVTYFKEFIDAILTNTSVRGVKIIAHSMGNQLIIEALHELSAKYPSAISDVVFAAPDVDRDVFESVLGGLKSTKPLGTLYASANDVSLRMSKYLAGGVPRAGDVPTEGPTIVAGIDTIDISGVKADALSFIHSTYAEAALLLNDIKLLFTRGIRPPNVRTPILIEVANRRGQYWKYPHVAGDVDPYFAAVQEDAISTPKGKKKLAYFVTVGGERTRADADALAAQLRSAYYLSDELETIEVKMRSADSWYAIRLRQPLAPEKAVILCSRLRAEGLAWCELQP